jgi:GST-like protein
VPIITAQAAAPCLGSKQPNQTEIHVIGFCFHPTPNPAKIALFLEEAGLRCEAVPVDTSKGEQHAPSFRTINPNGKVPAIVDTEGPGALETRVFDSTAILFYLAEKTGKFLGAVEDPPELLFWLLFLASGLGPFSGQAVHFEFAAPEGLACAVNRFRREVERHYHFLNEHLEGRNFIVGETCTIADISFWCWLDRALFWQMGSPHLLGGGFGHFYAYAPTKIECPIDRYAMEVKRQLDMLDRRLADSDFVVGADYAIADMATWPWYGGLVKGWLCDAAEFLSVQDYKNVARWMDQLVARPGVARGRKVSRTPSSELYERHDASDFKTKTQDILIGEKA